MGWLNIAARIADNKSLCVRAKTGSVIVSYGKMIGAGYNAPPADIKITRCLKDSLPKNFKSDRTCCVHAEQRAIKAATKTNSKKLAGSIIYFARLDSTGEIKHAGKPYCTICSKEILDSGIFGVVLLQREGPCLYDSVEYNELSFRHAD